jgi:pyruvate dehydrogenase (quinone)
VDHVPVLAICGQARATARGAHYQQELNLDRLFQDVADYVHEAAVPSQVRHLLDRAMRTALGRNGIGVLVLPNDLQEKPYEDPPRSMARCSPASATASRASSRTRPTCSARPTC